jgi:hypothetical protein
MPLMGGSVLKKIKKIMGGSESFTVAISYSFWHGGQHLIHHEISGVPNFFSFDGIQYNSCY